MDLRKIFIRDLVYCKTLNSLPSFLDKLDHIVVNKIGIPNTESVITDFIDGEFMNEIASYSSPNTSIYFGCSMKELKCVVVGDDGRSHEMWLLYNRPNNLSISSVNIPRSAIQDRIYKSLHEAITVFKKHISGLINYFEKLDEIDNFFTVVDPLRPTYKDDYRKVDLGNNIWLHLEVTGDGTARHMHLSGQVDRYNFGELLSAWDHDNDIIMNIRTIEDLVKKHLQKNSIDGKKVTKQGEQNHFCGICFCLELEDDTRVPQPLCQNCNMYFHNSCLFKWLVTCDRGRAPLLGVAMGVCPNCQKQVYCNEE